MSYYGTHPIIKVQDSLLLAYPRDMTPHFRGCLGFIFGVTVNMTGFCYEETLWHFIMKAKFNFKTINVPCFYICCCTSSAKLCQLGNNINRSPTF